MSDRKEYNDRKRAEQDMLNSAMKLNYIEY